jgi:hypothetical protein
MAKKVKKSVPGWDKIGELIGEKIEKESKNGDCCGGSWHKQMFRSQTDCGDGFFGRALFILGIYFVLNSLGLLAGIPMWAIVMTGIGFALMRF